MRCMSEICRRDSALPRFLRNRKDDVRSRREFIRFKSRTGSLNSANMTGIFNSATQQDIQERAQYERERSLGAAVVRHQQPVTEEMLRHARRMLQDSIVIWSSRPGNGSLQSIAIKQPAEIASIRH